MARYKSTARDLGAFICFEDEAGQGLSPPKGRTWARRWVRPVVKVNFAAAGLDGLVGIVKPKLKKIQYRPYLIDGCLSATGLAIEAW